jgi:peptidoglycan/xylan/chitin deacetylase (PgdA/CDA1 family)
MNGISILMYHQVGDFASVDSHRANYCHYKRFRSQMAYLKRRGYCVLGMDEVLACIQGERDIPSKAVALTFDDGYENFYQYALPVLDEMGFSAIVYLIAGKLGHEADWLADAGGNATLLMTREQILEARGTGIEFGSHGLSHVRLAALPQDVLHNEVVDSKAMLESLLGEEVRHFCYPFGSHDLNAADQVQAAGYQTAVTCLRAAATTAFDPMLLPRKAISYGDNLLGYFWKLAMKNAPKHEPLRR